MRLCAELERGSFSIAQSSGSGIIELFPEALWEIDQRHQTAEVWGQVTIGDIEKGDLFMKNIEMTVEGETLIIKVDLSKDFGPSKSGKTIIVASTEGNVSVLEREEKIGLNIYRYPE